MRYWVTGRNVYAVMVVVLELGDNHHRVRTETTTASKFSANLPRSRSHVTQAAPEVLCTLVTHQQAALQDVQVS
jgi:hypothetical protein